MSELKIFKDMEANCANCPFDITEVEIKRCYDDCGDKPNECYECSYLEYYLKSEADKVLAEKDKVIAELKSDIADLRDDKKLTDAILDERNAEIVELKKACNDKDDWCLHTLKENRHQKHKRCLAMAKWCNSENYTATWYHENTERCEWTEKWYERWLELAEEPTWAKFLQLIHKEAK